MFRNFNEKYQEQGSLFQGAYRSRTVNTDKYLRWAIAYILVKNVFELYPGGFARAVKEFDKAWKWGTEVYKFSSLQDFALNKPSPIISSSFMREMFNGPSDFKSCSRDMVTSRLEKLSAFEEGIIFE